MFGSRPLVLRPSPGRESRKVAMVIPSHPAVSPDHLTYPPTHSYPPSRDRVRQGPRYASGGGAWSGVNRTLSEGVGTRGEEVHRWSPAVSEPKLRNPRLFPPSSTAVVAPGDKG